MQSIKIRKRVGSDGILHLDIPIGITEKDLEVMVIYQVLETPKQQKTPEELGYPTGFFEDTYGACQDDLIQIYPQFDYE